MLGRFLGQSAGGIAIVGSMFIATWMVGFWFGTRTLPSPPDPPIPVEQIRSTAIQACFRDTTSRLNRSQPDPEVLANINEQCRRIYDLR
jgi:hypothetical protein